MEATTKEWWENPERFWFNAYTRDTNDEWASGWCFGKSEEEALASALERIKIVYPRVHGSRTISFQQDIKDTKYFSVDVTIKGVQDGK